jgi:ribonucleotide monophosphatase NagD (HAD superfamily)
METEDCVFIGDRLDTDIVLGNRAGIVSICVGTGVSTKEDADNATEEKKPTFFFESLIEMFDDEIF